MKISSTLLSLAFLLSLACVENPSPKHNDTDGREVPNRPLNPLPDPEPTPDGKIGHYNTFEYATWNIENFPKKGTTIEAVEKHLKLWELDVIALQEIESKTSFDQLVDSLDGYEGVVSQNPNIMFAGLIYNASELEILETKNILLEETYAFPRFPFHVKAKRLQDDQIINFVVVHLKAKGGSSNQNRRIRANKVIVSFVEEYLASRPEERFVVLGDFNSELDQEEMNPWGETNLDVTITTQEIDDQDGYSYFVGRRSLIDHIITINESVDQVMVPTPLYELSDYEFHISDHLPVIAVSNLPQ